MRVVDALSVADPKTKAAVAMLKGLGATGKTLVVDLAVDPTLDLSTRNIAGLCLHRRQPRLGARGDGRHDGHRDQGRARAPAGGPAMKLTDVIRRPLVTEKTSILKEQDGQSLVFQVAIDATKIEIKQAIEALLGAKVADVRTASMHGKVKRQGRFSGKRSDWKKAYVRLQDGEKVPEFLEGA